MSSSNEERETFKKMETNRPKIAVVGSLNMDLVVSMERMPLTGETVQGRAFQTVPGGKGANQAAGCGRLGAAVEMIGAAGEDAFGGELVRSLQGFGVTTEGVSRIAGVSSGVATIYHTEDDNCIVVVPGANASCTAELVEAHADRIRSADLLLVQLEVPLPAVKRALELARGSGVITVLNPAPARELPAELVALADYITPNETEFELLTGGAAGTEAELAARMRSWQEATGCRVLVTRGSRGCSFLREDGELATVPALKVEPVDTTGAGDTLNAALGVSLAAGVPLEEAVSFAVRAASLSVTKFGAQGGLPTLAEVRATYKG
ncbi:ribokinase [Paenibacillus gansuensis]|uniref:Ribokinase n=1 Tax=Paenibacillus gansuensis TaxID=306542 RepID=A0ABW5PFJ3_9BACL